MIHGLILAAGKGTRMKSILAKPLHLLHHKPLLMWVVENARSVCDDLTVVVSHQYDAIKRVLGNSVEYVIQAEQLGTGHAVASAQSHLQRKAGDTLLVLAADQPLISGGTMRTLLDAHKQADATISIATVIVPNFDNDFAGFYYYGRVIRNTKGDIERIAEFKECTESEKIIHEVNISCIAFDLSWLLKKIGDIQKSGTGEFYLMNLIPRALLENGKIGSYQLPNALEGFGINTPEELALAEDFTL